MSNNLRLVLAISIAYLEKLFTLPLIGERKLIPVNDLNELTEEVLTCTRAVSRNEVDSSHPIGFIKGMAMPQILPYIVVRYGGLYLTYSRAKGTEERLRANRSLGFGGHIDLDEEANATFPCVNSFKAVIRTDARREVQEELNINIDNISFTHAIVDYTNNVGKVHLGLLGVIDLTHDQFAAIEAAPNEIVDLQWHNINDLQEDSDIYENWSQMFIQEEFSRKGII